LTQTADDRKLEDAIVELGLDVEVVRVTTVLDQIWVDSPLRLFRYIAWIRAAGNRAASLEATGRFFVGHHVTFATSWLPTPLSRLATVPYVWGPVGGATYPAVTLRRELDLNGRMKEGLIRWVSRASRATLTLRSAARASTIVAINQDTARVFRRHPTTTVEPNAAFDYSLFPPVADDRASVPKRAVYAGRLLSYKGVGLAIKALADARIEEWTLDVFGKGPDEPRLVELARSLRLEERVHFRGAVSQAELFAVLQESSVFLFPSMREGGPWAVAEASAIGLKVVCFPLGGSAEMAGPNAVLLDPERPVTSIVEALAGIDARGVSHRVLDAQRIGPLCAGWYEGAVARTRGPARNGSPVVRNLRGLTPRRTSGEQRGGHVEV
jgi:glycosyltransferase involved in cell wall biosynthesis